MVAMTEHDVSARVAHLTTPARAARMTRAATGKAIARWRTRRTQRHVNVQTIIYTNGRTTARRRIFDFEKHTAANNPTACYRSSRARREGSAEVHNQMELNVCAIIVDVAQITFDGHRARAIYHREV